MSKFKEFFSLKENECRSKAEKFLNTLYSDLEEDLDEQELEDKYSDIDLDVLNVASKILDAEIKELDEKVKKTIVVRGRKKQKRFTSDKKGYRIVLDPVSGRPKEVRMPASERIRRSKAQKLGALKRRSQRSVSNFKRKASLKIRKQVIKKR